MSAKRSYETTVIINAGLEDIAVDGVINGIVEFIKNNGGEIQTLDKWGRKRLAYPIQKKNNGYYVYFLYESPATLPPMLERYFHLDENIIRHLTVYLEGQLLSFRKKALEQKALAEDKNTTGDKPDEGKAKEAEGEKSGQLEKDISVKVGS